MGARLRVFLTSEQNKTLLNLKTADVPQKIKDRAEVIRLNAHGWYVEKIAAHFKWTCQTGIKARGEKGNYSTKRIKLDSNASG